MGSSELVSLLIWNKMTIRPYWGNIWVRIWENYPCVCLETVPCRKRPQAKPWTKTMTGILKASVNEKGCLSGISSETLGKSFTGLGEDSLGDSEWHVNQGFKQKSHTVGLQFWKATQLGRHRKWPCRFQGQGRHSGKRCREAGRRSWRLGRKS